MPIRYSTAYSGSYQTRNSGFVPWTTQMQTFTNITDLQVTMNHPGWYKERSADVGGPFLSNKVTYEIAPGYASNALWNGPFVVAQHIGGPTAYGHAGIINPATEQANGAIGISRTIPTNPAFSMSTAIGELAKDGLPQIIGSAAYKNQVSRARQAGGEYLNYQFGWLPLVSDLRKFAYAVKHRDQIMKSYLKGSDKKIRRSYSFPDDAGKSRSFTATGYVGTQSSMSGVCHVEERAFRRSWFDGAYRYHVPMSVQQKERGAYFLAQAQQILGLELTPEVVWNLAPWSWAVDWFTNTGDVMKNISRLGKDGLVLQYGYQMTHTLTSKSIRFESAQYGSSYMKRTYETKQRIPATPYGFGLSFDGLSNTQKAVIVALGLSRGKRSRDPYLE